MHGGIARLLALTGGDYAADLSAQLTAFVRFLLLHLAVRDWLKVADAPSGTRLGLAAGFTACFVASMVDARRLGSVLAVAMGLATWKLAWNLPNPSNHFAVEYLCLVFLCTLRLWHPAEREPLVASLRWLVAWVFLASGVQKILHGTYFSGALMATLIAQERFALVLGPLLPVPELVALTDPAFDGPYRLQSAAGLAVSNAVYLLEIATGLLLMWRRARPLGVVLAIGLLVAIEAGARELTFGLLVTSLLTLYLGGAATLWMLRLGAGAYAFLLATKLGVLPSWFFN